MWVSIYITDQAGSKVHLSGSWREATPYFSAIFLINIFNIGHIIYQYCSNDGFSININQLSIRIIIHLLTCIPQEYQHARYTSSRLFVYY